MLAVEFEKFWNNSLKDHELCPSHYLSTPTLSWDAMISMTKVELELISDAEVESLIFPRDIVKLTVSIWNLMIQNNDQNTLYT